MTYSNTYQTLTQSNKFKTWKKSHPDCYLTHFYCQLDNSFKQTAPWEIGFYNKEKDKITTFVINKKITIKPEEKVFKKEGTVEELDLKKVKINSQQALETFKKIKQENYPQEILLNGFLILQNFQNKLMWNISFATKSMQILNVKVDATNEKIISEQLISFVERKAS